MRKCNYHPYIDSYMDDIRSGVIPASKDTIRVMDYIEFKLDNPNVIIWHEKIEKAVELVERYFEMKLFNWELFIYALIHCYYQEPDSVVFDEFLIMMGRGNGKNGFISGLAWYLTTHYHGVKEYNIDIIANSEEQAKTSFSDVYNVLKRTWAKSKKFFYKSLEIIVNLKTGSYIKYNTSNAKTKDGKRSACLIFDEKHEYEDWTLINVFTSGFGKKKHSRIFSITTQGHVRGGVLDDELKVAEEVLNGQIKDTGLLPLLYRIDKKEEYENRDLWVKACPSFPYLTELQIEMDKVFIKMKYQPRLAIDFLTKRMNWPSEDVYTVVAPWEKIEATNKPIPYDEISGLSCIGWVDYAQINDFCSVGLMFKHRGKRICIEHTFVCHLALQIESRPIKFPVQEAVNKGLITIVKWDFEGKPASIISADVIADWFLDQAKKYNIQVIACDAFRASVLEKKFTEKGLPLKTVRSGPITHAKLSSLVETIFAEETLILGDNMTMRWYVNNTYQQMDQKGNITYLKIEQQTRKTDGFFGFLHALSLDAELIEVQENIQTYDVRTY